MREMPHSLTPDLHALVHRESFARWRRNVLVLLALAAAVILLTAPLWWERSIAFELAGSYAAPGLTGLGWYAVTEHGFMTCDDFAAVYARQTGGSLAEDFDLNTAHYSYVVCPGCALKRLTYREWDRSGRFTAPDGGYYYAHAYVRPEADPETVNIYRTKNLAFDNDPHTVDPELTVVGK